MPDEDPGDIFLRHRGAVLEALLSDPSFGAPAESETGTANSAEPDFPEEFDVPLPPGAEGPKASERILALLNAGAGEENTPEEFGSDFAGFDPARLRGDPDAASGESPRPRPVVPGSADRLRGVLAVVRKPKVALAIGAVLAVIVVLVLVSGGGSTPSNSVVIATAAPTPAAANLPTTTAPAASTALQVKSAQAHCPAGSTSGMDAFAGQGKAWLCVRAFKVDGQVLTIDLGHTYQIDSIGIVPGFDNLGSDGVDQWTKYRTASRVSYQFDDANASKYVQQTLDQRTLVITKLSPPVSASRIVLTVLQSKGDPAINTVALSSITITGQ
ncbi:discoidin domain-containing protein [Nocardia sp. NBC_01388]|uniref:discoidin domain-containing protein n=1 Tax=Nocardia sp. NBC_01388 TaxID=2903596 RepID=UPI00324C5640